MMPETGTVPELWVLETRASYQMANQKEGRQAEVLFGNKKCGSFHGPPGGSYGGVRAGPEGAPEAERHRGAWRDEAEEEEKGQRQGQDAGSHGDEQEERGGEEALPGQAHAGAGGLREDARETANGKNPEEGIQNPQAESGGLQQTPGHAHRALRHSQSQLDQVAVGKAGPANHGVLCVFLNAQQPSMHRLSQAFCNLIKVGLFFHWVLVSCLACSVEN